MSLQITILGLNKIGASLGLALGTLDQEALPGGRPVITGWDRDRRAVSDARGRLMIDREGRDPADAVREADVVWVCVPAAEVVETFDLIAPHLKHGAIVADTGASKQHVLEQARRHLPTTVEFIGSHPIVDRPDGDQRDASLDLFKEAIFCLVPGSRARPEAIDVLAVLVRAIGAKAYYIDAGEHDAYVAGAQQLPLLLSAALMETLRRSGGWREMQALAGESLQQMTRPLEGNVLTSAAAYSDNQAALHERLNELIRVLVEIRDNLEQREVIETIFDAAHELHEQWMASTPHMRPGEAEFIGQPQAENSYSISGLFFGHRRKRPDKGKR
jgi:prephenate dehydrogenase